MAATILARPSERGPMVSNTSEISELSTGLTKKLTNSIGLRMEFKLATTGTSSDIYFMGGDKKMHHIANLVMVRGNLEGDDELVTPILYVDPKALHEAGTLNLLRRSCQTIPQTDSDLIKELRKLYDTNILPFQVNMAQESRHMYDIDM
jgi:hypothetical protein